MSFLVCHVEKFKKNDVKGIEIHNNRNENYELKNKEIDITKKDENYDLVACENYSKKIEKIIKENYTGTKKICSTGKKSATVMAGIVISSDNDFFRDMSRERQQKFFETSLEFLQKKYPHVVSATIHNDEKTPHMHVYVVPITADGRLSAKDEFNAKNLKFLQDRLPKALQSAGFEIERGLEGSTAKHLSEIKFKIKKEGEKLSTIEKQIDEAKAIHEFLNISSDEVEKAKEKIAKDWEEVNKRKEEIALLKKEIGDMTVEKERLKDGIESLTSETSLKQRLIDDVQKDFVEYEKSTKEIHEKTDVIFEKVKNIKENAKKIPLTNKAMIDIDDYRFLVRTTSEATKSNASNHIIAEKATKSLKNAEERIEYSKTYAKKLEGENEALKAEKKEYTYFKKAVLSLDLQDKIIQKAKDIYSAEIQERKQKEVAKTKTQEKSRGFSR